MLPHDVNPAPAVTRWPWLSEPWPLTLRSTCRIRVFPGCSKQARQPIILPTKKTPMTYFTQTHRIARSLLAIAGIWLATPLSGMAGTDKAVVDQNQRGTKYSALTQINRDNVANLVPAWQYNTGDKAPEDSAGMLVSMQDQPSIIEGNLIICSVKRRIIALDPATGEERWTFDPKTPETKAQKCRGISNWVDEEAPEGSACRSRILFGTADYQLVAIDAKTGKACEGFGDRGFVKMPTSKPELFVGEVMATSDPAVVNDVVVVGSAVADNQRVDAPSGRVLAYSARTGEPLWQFDPVPRDPEDPAMATWGKGTDGFGQANVWSSMAVDHDLDLVYLPTTSASNDFFGGERPGNNEYSTSVVALRGATGEVAWHFQTTHHNVFDYDIPSRPMLIDYPVNGEMVPALVQNTKMGMIFIFNRATGEPLVPIEERPVPQDGAVEGEVLSPTQPFPVGMPNLVPHGFSPEDTWGFTFIDKWLCKSKAEDHLYGDIYTPASLQGTIFSPSAGGGPNWGGGAYDPDSHVMVVPSNRVPMIVKLIPRVEAGDVAGQKIELGGAMVFNTPGSPYVLEISPLLSAFGAPCSTPPWASLTAVDLVKKAIVWEVPLGNIDKMMPFPIDMELGTPGAGGPLLTAGGLVFIGYTLDDRIRAFDVKTGETLWKADLPAAGTAVPVTYEVNGEQYLVIAAGGHTMYGSTTGDAVVAYKLKR